MLQKWRDNIGSKTSDVLLDKQFGILQLEHFPLPALEKQRNLKQTIPLLFVSSMLSYSYCRGMHEF